MLEDNDKYLIYDFESTVKLAEHKIIKVKGKLSKNRDHGRKKSDNIDKLIDKIIFLFPDNKRADKFLSRIRKEKHRYIRDQLLVIEKSLEDKDSETITKALEYCIGNKLYSASDFRDVITFYDREKVKIKDNNILLVADNIALNEKDKEKLAAKPAVRDLDVYQKIFNS